MKSVGNRLSLHFHPLQAIFVRLLFMFDSFRGVGWAGAYLLLVSFFTPPIRLLSPEKLRPLNESPFAGVAVPIMGAYEVQVPDEGDLVSRAEALRAETRAKIWPWVFWNQVVGCAQEDSESRGCASKNEIAKSIRGIDIFDAAGALSRFYKTFALALRMARANGAPGIVVDPEAYNDYDSETVPDLAEHLGMSQADIEARCLIIGNHLADIVGEVYPSAALWFLFTGLDHPKGRARGRDRVIAVVIKGLLERSARLGLPMRLIDGGETSGYCFASLARLRAISEQRRNEMAIWSNRFAALRLAGTITVWSSSEKKRGWLRKGECGRAAAADFPLLLAFLANNYSYVWIYGAMDSDYNPYASESANSPINALLFRAFSRAQQPSR